MENEKITTEEIKETEETKATKVSPCVVIKKDVFHRRVTTLTAEQFKQWGEAISLYASTGNEELARGAIKDNTLMLLLGEDFSAVDYNEQQYINKCNQNSKNAKSGWEKRKQVIQGKMPYGEYDNVYLTKEQYDDLFDRYPNECNDLIERLSEYMQSAGKTYKDHYATLLIWGKQDYKY